MGETASDKKARRRMGAEEEEARQRAEGERIVEEDPAWMTPERAEQVRIVRGRALGFAFGLCAQ